jgi:regulator of sigma E protease
LIDYLGDKGTLAVTVKTTTGKIQQHQLDLSNWKVSPYRPEILPSLGIPSWWQTQKNIHGLSDLLLEPHYNLLTAIAAAATQIDLMSMLNFYVLYKLFTGTLPLTILAGPVALYKTAEIAYQNGFVAFLEILGALSISLGLINLLPIPGLDGSHVIYLLIEKVRKKPFSPAFEALLFRLGFIIIAILLIQVITNDLVRWL